MRLSLDLRHDLAKMSDAELADRLERIWQTCSQAEADAWPHKVFASLRGPIRHPLAYPFLSWVGVRAGIGMAFGPAFGFSVEGLLWKRGRALMRMHLGLCEARDITDEIKRRVARSPG
jgi:hypothetical protein